MRHAGGRGEVLRRPTSRWFGAHRGERHASRFVGEGLNKPTPLDGR